LGGELGGITGGRAEKRGHSTKSSGYHREAPLTGSKRIKSRKLKRSFSPRKKKREGGAREGGNLKEKNNNEDKENQNWKTEKDSRDAKVRKGLTSLLLKREHGERKWGGGGGRGFPEVMEGESLLYSEKKKNQGDHLGILKRPPQLNKSAADIKERGGKNERAGT